MSAQPIAPDEIERIADQCTWTVLTPNPYADVPTEVLADTLEGQYERGEPFNADMVFEAVNRAFDADELRSRFGG